MPTLKTFYWAVNLIESVGCPPRAQSSLISIVGPRINTRCEAYAAGDDLENPQASSLRLKSQFQVAPN